jgi:hypothetical protein
MSSLAALGCGFDCASAKEMADVLNMGVHPSRIIFAHPCKRPADLAHAAATSVTVCFITSSLVASGCNELQATFVLAHSCCICFEALQQWHFMLRGESS